MVYPEMYKITNVLVKTQLLAIPNARNEIIEHTVTQFSLCPPVTDLE